MSTLPDVWFPNIGIKISRLPQIAFTVFGVKIYCYALFIITGIIVGLFLAIREAKRTGQNPDTYYDFFMWALPISIICARLYYVIFSWSYYKNDPKMIILGIRQGGLAIYGGVIGAVITILIYSKIKKINPFLLSDTMAPSLIIGQAIGRWGNFTNREAFGAYTDNILAMRYKKDQVFHLTKNILDNLKNINGVEYIQVHPTFLYESLWNLLVFIFLMFYRKHKKFTGEITLLYFLYYGIGRTFIESLRTDQLLIGNTNIAVSQLISIVLALISFIIIFYKRYRLKKQTTI